MDLEKIPYQFIYTDLTVKNLQRDLELIKIGPFKIKEPYVKSLEKLISEMIEERRKLKETMRKHNIRIEQGEVEHDIVVYRIYMNGKMKEMRINKYVLKNKVREKMLQLM